MNEPQIVSHAQWLDARKALLAEEKAFTRQRDALSAKRQALPWEAVKTPYVFTGPAGPEPLAGLFGTSSQLIIYHFMFGPDWEQGCKSCSFWADHFDAMGPHLKARDVAMAAVSAAPVARLEAFRQRMGWTFTWVSSAGTSFNADFGVSPRNGEAMVYNYDQTKTGIDELPGLSVFATDRAGHVFHTYSCYARGLDMLNGTYQHLDLVSRGRDEGGLEY